MQNLERTSPRLCGSLAAFYIAAAVFYLFTAIGDGWWLRWLVFAMFAVNACYWGVRWRVVAAAR